MAAVFVLVLVAAASWWYRHADERRVDAACDSYLQQRGQLRGVLSETEEATERAVDADADRVKDRYFNDADEVRSRIDQWLLASPDIIDSLDRDKDASALDRDAVRSLTFIDEGFMELSSLIEESEPSGVAGWLPEVEARMQGFDDTCLWVARDA